MPRAGETSPYRARPENFEQAFVEHGWGGVGAILRAHRRNIKRWLIEAGEARLRAARRMYLEQQYATRGKRVPGIRPGLHAD